MYQRLLVPLDGSILAEAVLPLVERLAPVWGSTVILLHVIERAAPTAVHGEHHLSKAQEAQRYLETTARRLQEHGIPVDYHVHEVAEGDVARSIVGHAAEKQAELIVLCTHGKGRMRELLFGTIAQQVLRHGTTPVLLARPAADQAAVVFSPRVILVPLDGTAAAEAALDPALVLARAFHARLHLVMVVATQETVRGDRTPAATLLPSATRAVLDIEEQEAASYLQRLAATLASTVAITTEVRRGDIASTLLDETAGVGAGLIVLATHGRAGLQAVWAGSVAARLLGRTRQPVLLLRRIES